MVKNVSRGDRVVNTKVGKDQVGQVTVPAGAEIEVEGFVEDDAFNSDFVARGDLVVDGAEPEEVNQEAVFENDPRFVANRALAEAAGHTEGYADPLPEGAEEEGEESEEGAAPRRRGRKSKR
jgi:hypothetical protein